MGWDGGRVGQMCGFPDSQEYDVYTGMLFWFGYIYIHLAGKRNGNIIMISKIRICKLHTLLVRDGMTPEGEKWNVL
jgi:hypothetical protein